MVKEEEEESVSVFPSVLLLLLAIRAQLPDSTQLTFF